MSNTIGRAFDPRSGQTKDYRIGICCFSTKHAALRRKSKDWLARNQNNVSEWSDMSTRGLLFQISIKQKELSRLEVLNVENRVKQICFNHACATRSSIIHVLLI
jgi:hypothetical protein